MAEPAVVTADAELNDSEITSADPGSGRDDLVLDELLVEDVSIDGMCGVY